MAMSAASIALKLQDLSNQATEKSFQYNTAEANTARAWQKEMSDTAHQREVADLKAAGLNPVLASNNGAQSYTTSSASAQAENAANAVGNVWSSDISARATRAAAAESAAATRYAAAAQASAARYAASLQYQAQVEGFKNQKDINAATNKSNQIVASIQNKKSLWGNIRDIFEKNGVKNKDFTQKFAYTANEIRNDNTGKFLLSPSKGMSFNNLNWRSKKFLQSSLRATGLSVNLQNQMLAYRALIKQESSAVKQWSKLVSQYNTQKNNAINRIYNRTGFGVW